MPSGSHFESFDQGARLRRLSAALEDPRWILTGIGALLESASQRAFREEKMGPVKWKSRQDTGMVPNWPAIVSHFATKTGAPPARNFGAAHTLTGTGRLRGSIRSRVVGEDTVEVGSNVPYAKALHEGGESETPKITKPLQDRLRAWMDKTKGAALRAAKKAGKEKTPEAQSKATDKLNRAEDAMAPSLRRLLNKNLRGEKLTIRHPVRPLVGLPDDIVNEIEVRYGARVRRVS